MRLDGFLFFVLERHAADDDVQFFAADSFRRFLLQLFGGKMDQKVRNAYDRIVIVFADHYVQNRAVLFCDDAVQRERDGHPLVLFDTAVIMRVQICKARILIQRILL